MKAYRVFETINFERNGDPKEKMKIGQASSYVYNIVKILTGEVVTNTKPEYKVKEGKDWTEDDFKLIQIFLPLPSGEYSKDFMLRWSGSIHKYYNNWPAVNAIDKSYIEIEEATGKELSSFDIVFYSKPTNKFFGTEPGDFGSTYKWMSEKDHPYLKDYKDDLPGDPNGVVLNLYVSF